MSEVSYVITDGVNYLAIGKSGNSLTNDINKAMSWTREKSATNTLKALQGSTRSVLSKFANKEDFDVEAITKEEIDLLYNFDDAMDIDFNLHDDLKLLRQKFIILSKRKQELADSLSELDKKISDIMHCAEFYELDACRGYKLYKILHQTRIERREVKNELMAIGQVLVKIPVENINGSILEIEKAYSENKKYKPRIVDELFDLLK